MTLRADRAPGPARTDVVLQPVSGKAVEVYEGEILRITQIGGEQCVDFNCFSLHDHKERMSVGHTRAQGFRIKQGHVIVTNPPRYRPMLAVTHMAETCVTDLLGSRCDGTLGEREWGLDDRTNCQDTLAEAIREYRLTPDDVHDSLNFWMHTYWTEEGTMRHPRAVGPPGDYVDLLAIMDVLAIPVTCGSGDIGQLSNFSFKPIRVQVFEATPDTKSVVDGYQDQFGGYANQVDRTQFAVKGIKPDRALRHVPGFTPRFRHHPMEWKDIEVNFTPDELDLIQPLVGRLGRTSGDVARSLFMFWYLKNRAKAPLLRP